jgi:hypothetical protein
MGTNILHLRVKKDYAQQLLELLLKDDAIENIVEEEEYELTDEQKADLDVELQLRTDGKNEYKNWNDIKGKYGL